MDGLAIDRQREDCLKIAKSRGWQVVEEYRDQSMSTSDKTKRWPDCDRVVSDFEARQVRRDRLLGPRPPAPAGAGVV